MVPLAVTVAVAVAVYAAQGRSHPNPTAGVYLTNNLYLIPHSPDDTLISGRLSTIKVYISVV
jgi:hypothetical protein